MPCDPYPDSLFRRGRSKDATFDDDENLFIRLNKVNSDGKIDVSCIRSTHQSVNRERYSQAEWVLCCDWPKYCKWGYGRFLVSDIPEDFAPDQTDTAKTYYFSVNHEPLENNYSHSEIVVSNSPDYDPQLDRLSSRQAKNHLRMTLREAISLIKHPET